MAKKRSHSPEDDEEVDDENRENGSYEEEMEEEVEEEEEDHDDGGRRRRKKKKQDKKFQVMRGQSEAERRVLRRKQRDLHSDIAMGAGASAAEAGVKGEDNGDDALIRLRDQNNELWNDVRFTREAVLDSENVDLIASKAAREAEKLVQVPRYDAARLAQSLVRKGTVGTGSSSQFSWCGLGFQVGVCFNALPSHVSFLYGPLDAEYAPKERKKTERRKKQDVVESENEEEEQPEDCDQTGKKKEKDGNELSAVEQHITTIRKTLSDRASEEKESAKERVSEYQSQLSQEIDDETELLKKKKRFIKTNSQVNAVNCLFNPNSFTQTVENVFHFSFLVKESLAGIRSRSVEEAKEFGGTPGPQIRPTREEVDMSPPRQAIVALNMKVRNKPKPDAKQAIVKLDMKDWKDMCAAYNVEESDVPHRVDGKCAKKEKKGKKRKSN